MSEFNWWLLIVGLVVGAGLVWLVLADSTRRESEVEARELPAEAAWIADAMADQGRPIDRSDAEAVLRLHRAYLAAAPPDETAPEALPPEASAPQASAPDAQASDARAAMSPDAAMRVHSALPAEEAPPEAAMSAEAAPSEAAKAPASPSARAEGGAAQQGEPAA